MAKFRLDVEKLKEEYIGKTINWLTIIDVIRDSKNRIMFRCQCKCGNTVDVIKSYALNNRVKSCGCYNKSKEKAEKCSQWCKDNPEKVAIRGKKHSKWMKENPDKVAAAIAKRNITYQENPEILKCTGKKISQWYKDHPDEVATLSNNRKNMLADESVRLNLSNKVAAYHTNNRKNVGFSKLVDVIHPKYIDDLLNGKLDSDSVIETRCPKCNKYSKHSLHNVFTMSTSNYKERSGRESAKLCTECRSKMISSLYEDEIADFISTFYSGEPIRNTRSVISPKELDLYYPEKKIAIEFNGDYFHNEEHKDEDYHYNKFKQCADKNIVLISIFENHWLNNKEEIKKYLIDLFNDNDNELSFNKDGLMDNNYPSRKYLHITNEHISDFYTINGFKVYTCGYSKIEE
jgi:hypothetical protein